MISQGSLKLELFFALASRGLVALSTLKHAKSDPKATALVLYVLSFLIGRHGSRISPGGTSAKGSDGLRLLPE